MQDINKANLFMSKEVGVADTEYYLLFRERRPEIMQKRIQKLNKWFCNMWIGC